MADFDDGRSGLRRFSLVAAVLVFGAACGGRVEEPAPSPPTGAGAAGESGESAGSGDDSGAVFIERAAATGLDFVHQNGMSGELYLAEITCGGGALFDYDGDGDLDVYLLQGRMLGDGKTLADALRPTPYPEPLTDRLYRNDLAVGADGSRELTFTDVTAELGVATTGYGCGVAAGDFDNDGWIDLYLTNLGPNQLLRNRGARRSGGAIFEDVTVSAGVGDPGSGVTATFFDYDGDGFLDLFLGNNVTFDLSGATRCFSLSGAPDYCGPGAYPAERDRLFHNSVHSRGAAGGSGLIFEDVTAASGLGSAPPRPTLGSVAGDFDNDGDLDLYVANDGQPNNLWLNQGGGRFVDEALLAGCALDGSGAAEASMGVDAGDFDGDGDLDLFLAHLVKETNTLYRNDGRGGFADHTAALGLAAPSLPYTSFGAGWVDYDNDGWLDLLVVNGAVTLLPELAASGDPFPLHQRNQLFRSRAGAAFDDVSAQAGAAFALSEVSRGAAFGDLDHDGDVDAVVINNGGPARLLLNQVGARRGWLGVRLVTGEPPRDVLGATVALLRPEGAGRHVQQRRVHTDGSYSSASDPRLLFGLGDDPASTVGVRVTWPNGRVEEWRDLAVRRYHTLRQGEGEAGS